MPKQKHKSIWRVWALALGEKASPCNKESDRVAIVRTIIFFTYLLTNLFIIANAIRHWNDIEYSEPRAGDLRPLRRDLRGEEAALGDVCLLLTNGRSGDYHISDAGELRCRDPLLP
jgi:hypothetical protein